MRAVAAAALLVLAGCAMPPVNPQADSDTARIEQKIVRACVASGLFQIPEALVEAAVPLSVLPIAVLNAGTHLVCADPHRFAGDISSVEWVAKNLPKKPG